MEEKENETVEQPTDEEIQAHVKEQWLRMWGEDITKVRERLKKFSQDPELIKKLGEMIVKEVGE